MADVAEPVDQDHARMRKIMNPAFAASQLKSFLPLFRASVPAGNFAIDGFFRAIFRRPIQRTCIVGCLEVRRGQRRMT